jgi:Coenzyme PQQ synthesis protein D (PqqD)
MLRLRTDDLLWRSLGHEVVVLDLRTSKYFTANVTAGVLLDRLKGGAERDDLVRAVQDRFDVDADTAAGDVDGFITSLRDRGFLAVEVS